MDVASDNEADGERRWMLARSQLRTILADSWSTSPAEPVRRSAGGATEVLSPTGTLMHSTTKQRPPTGVHTSPTA